MNGTLIRVETMSLPLKKFNDYISVAEATIGQNLLEASGMQLYYSSLTHLFYTSAIFPQKTCKGKSAHFISSLMPTFCFNSAPTT